MNRTTLSLLGAVALVLISCVVTSVYPFYTAKDVVFEPALLGVWTNTAAADQRWKFEKQGGSAYRLTCVDGKERTIMQAQPFKLQGQLFLDLSRTNAADEPFPPGIPSHVLLRVLQTAPSLRMAAPKYDWLKELLEKDSKVLRHHFIKTGDGVEDRYFVLTADTEELRQFVMQRLQTDAAWKDQFELKRDSAPWQP